jgi:Aldo/keto reductase family
MEYTQLGRTGLKVGRIVLGTMNFGGRTDEPTSHAIMDAAHDAGVNFFDTANIYGRDDRKGLTEEVLGNWFARGGGRREKTALATGAGRDLPGAGAVAGGVRLVGRPGRPEHTRPERRTVRRRETEGARPRPRTVLGAAGQVMAAAPAGGCGSSASLPHDPGHPAVSLATSGAYTVIQCGRSR